MAEMWIKREREKKERETGEELARKNCRIHQAGKGVDRRRTDVMPSGTSFLNQWARLPLCGRCPRVPANCTDGGE